MIYALHDLPFQSFMHVIDFNDIYLEIKFSKSKVAILTHYLVTKVSCTQKQTKSQI